MVAHTPPATGLFLEAWAITLFRLFSHLFLKNNFFGGWKGSDQTHSLSLMTCQHPPKNRWLLLFLANEVFPIPQPCGEEGRVLWADSEAAGDRPRAPTPLRGAYRAIR